MRRIRLVLVDDHPIVLDGLEQLFGVEGDFEVVGRATDAEMALRVIEDRQPDVVVLDLAMPRRDGLWLLQQISERHLDTRVVLLTAHLDEHRFGEAVRLGAAGVVLKEMAPRLLVECVRKVHAGEQWLEPQEVVRARKRLRERESEREQVLRLLTPRELEIVQLAARGMRNREIATMLSITEGTVKIHLHNIYEKLGVTGRPQLILIATRHGLG
ncbi:MAG TPA: response regulator transcription factor [Methylomirabilota bacterium]